MFERVLKMSKQPLQRFGYPGWLGSGCCLEL